MNGWTDKNQHYEPTPDEIEDYESQQQRLANEWQASEAAEDFDCEKAVEITDINSFTLIQALFRVFQ